LLEVHAEGAVKVRNVRKWCRLFGDGMTNVQDAKRSGSPYLFKDGKAMHLQAWRGPDDSRSLRLLDFTTIDTGKW